MLQCVQVAIGQGRLTPPVTRASGFDIAVTPTLSGATRLLESAGLPTSDLDGAQLRNFFYVGTASGLIGLIGLELLGTCALLRSLVVAQSVRTGGMGTALLGHAECHARSQGVRDLFLLTTTAEDFFARRGFVRVRREDAPPPIRATREFAGICPASSVLMTKRL
jgi:amino-acid N-acetyltransferase